MKTTIQVGVLVLASALAVPAFATMDHLKAAKAAAIADVTNCQSCHVDKLPKKDAAALAERGKFLVDQKAAKKAEKIDVNWLKDYKPATK